MDDNVNHVDENPGIEVPGILSAKVSLVATLEIALCAATVTSYWIPRIQVPAKFRGCHPRSNP